MSNKKNVWCLDNVFEDKLKVLKDRKCEMCGLNLTMHEKRRFLALHLDGGNIVTYKTREEARNGKRRFVDSYLFKKVGRKWVFQE